MDIAQTNNSTKTRAVCADQLRHHGISAKPEEVVTSGYVMAQYLIDTGLVPGDKVYVIGEVGALLESPLSRAAGGPQACVSQQRQWLHWLHCHCVEIHRWRVPRTPCPARRLVWSRSCRRSG